MAGRVEGKAGKGHFCETNPIPVKPAWKSYWDKAKNEANSAAMFLLPGAGWDAVVHAGDGFLGDGLLE